MIVCPSELVLVTIKSYFNCVSINSCLHRNKHKVYICYNGQDMLLIKETPVALGTCHYRFSISNIPITS